MKAENIPLRNSNKLQSTPFSQAAPVTFPPLSNQPRTSLEYRLCETDLTTRSQGKSTSMACTSLASFSVFWTLSSFFTSGHLAPYVWNSLPFPCQAASLSPMKSLFLSAFPSAIILTFPLDQQLRHVSSCSWFFYLPLVPTLQMFSHGKKTSQSF